MERTKIYVSKREAITTLLISAAFVSLGIFVASAPTAEFGVKGFAVFGTLFFSLGIYVGIKQIQNPKLALIIGPRGIELNPKEVYRDFISWDNIVGFERIKINGKKHIAILVKDPELIIANESVKIKREFMLDDFKKHKSPYNFPSHNLAISHKKLLQKLRGWDNRIKSTFTN